ncbi:DUF2292 domain-containing protein [Planococcaceae bacterium Storch 2/2-2]|nr:DUF2292 domain-containing protein [Planococcaceae bacterium Storch 2/2-2]
MTTNERQQLLQAIEATLDRVQFGEIRLTIHHGTVVQLETTEKVRLSS